MLKIIFISVMFLFAHEDLETTTCKNGDSELTMTNNGNDTYLFSYAKDKKAISFKKPKVKDFWDAKKKQLFDTYSFESKEHKVIFKRPETKGPVKSTMAEYKGQTFKCQ